MNFESLKKTLRTGNIHGGIETRAFLNQLEQFGTVVWCDSQGQYGNLLAQDESCVTCPEIWHKDNQKDIDRYSRYRANRVNEGGWIGKLSIDIEVPYIHYSREVSVNFHNYLVDGYGKIDYASVYDIGKRQYLDIEWSETETKDDLAFASMWDVLKLHSLNLNNPYLMLIYEVHDYRRRGDRAVTQFVMPLCKVARNQEELRKVMPWSMPKTKKARKERRDNGQGGRRRKR